MNEHTQAEPGLESAYNDPMISDVQVSPSRTARMMRFVLALSGILVVVVGGLAGYRYRERIVAIFDAPPPTKASEPEDVVQVAGPNLVRVVADSPLEKKLVITTTQMRRVATPVLDVTGSVVARLAPGTGIVEGRWDFATPEIAAAYGDWVKARADVAFAEQQKVKLAALVKDRVDTAKFEVERWKKLFKIGTETERDLKKAEADLRQTELQGDKDLHEADNTIMAAQRNRGLLERQLLQAGVDPDVVSQNREGMCLVVADVPETKIPLVKKDQACEATFFSVPNHPFRGRVGRVGPSVSKERRTLRITFELPDTDTRLLPGAFAEIGLGTETRNLMTVPAESLLHIGRSDYVLVETEKNIFRACPVQVGEVVVAADSGTHSDHGSFVAITSTELHEGDRVVATGAILLKPVVVRALNGATHE